MDRGYLQKKLIEQFALEVSHELGSSYSSITNISSTFLFERLVERLQGEELPFPPFLTVNYASTRFIRFRRCFGQDRLSF